MMLVSEVDELESLGLPPKDADIVIFSVKRYLPMRWIVANPKAFKEKNIPTADSFALLNLAKSLSLSETFAVFLEGESHSRNPTEVSMTRDSVPTCWISFISLHDSIIVCSRLLTPLSSCAISLISSWMVSIHSDTLSLVVYV